MTNKAKAFLEAYQGYLSKQKLKFTKQRLIIAQEFFAAENHISAEELFNSVKRRDQSIGLASIYRTLNSLVHAGLAIERRFLDKTSRYEIHKPGSHHDHLICMRCHKIFEFENDEIENLQNVVANGLGFSLVDHRMELHGYCQRQNCPNL